MRAVVFYSKSLHLFMTLTCAAADLAAAAAGTSNLDSCLLIGTNTGFLQLHAADTGDVLHRQQLHNKAVVAISVRYKRQLWIVSPATKDTNNSADTNMSQLRIPSAGFCDPLAFREHWPCPTGCSPG